MPPAARIPSRRDALLRLYLPLGILFGMFAIVLVERSVIRAHWWAFRLARTSDPGEQGYYLACLATTGEPAAGAVRRLAGDERADVRALAVFALQRLPEAIGLADLVRLMSDDDATVGEAAASALAFMNTTDAMAALVRAVAQLDERSASAAAAALARADPGYALPALCNTVAGHPSPRVRAQAIESLAGFLHDENPASKPVSAPDSKACDPLVVLIRAMRDSERFDGRLALEKQISAASARVGAVHEGTEESRRTVGGLAASVLRDRTGLAINERLIRSDSDERRLVDECWRRLSDRDNDPR